MTDIEPPQRLPLTLQSAYADLLDRLQDDALLDVGGTPVLRARGDRRYWYAVHRLPERTIEKYLGPDGPEIRRSVETLQASKETVQERERQRRPLARMCKSGGLPPVDAQTGKVLRALAMAGLFRLRGVLVGTHAFRCYPGLLGVRIPEAFAVTEDIDVAAFEAVAVAIDDRLEPAFDNALRQVGQFAALPSLYDQPTRWRDRDSGIAVEFLTPNRGSDREAPVELPAIGVHARPLRFLDYVIHQPTQAAVLYRSGILVNVPQPARYAIHKLIVATRRPHASQAKSAKDTAQAAALIGVLAADRPDDLEEAFRQAQDRGPSWREHIAKGMARLPLGVQSALRIVTGQ